MSNFSDIAIVRVDAERTCVADAARRAMYDIYLELSDSAPTEWAMLFADGWRHHIYMKKRDARVEGQYLIVTCPLDELETSQLPELRVVLQMVNSRYRQHLAEQDHLAKRAEERSAAEERRKREILGRIRFD